MGKRFAVLVDGGFITKRLGALNARGKAKNPPTPQQVLAECQRLAQHPSLVGFDLLRIYYYDAPPATGNLTNPLSRQTINLGRTPRFAASIALQDAIELSPDVALRR